MYNQNWVVIYQERKKLTLLNFCSQNLPNLQKLKLEFRQSWIAVKPLMMNLQHNPKLKSLTALCTFLKDASQLNLVSEFEDIMKLSQMEELKLQFSGEYFHGKEDFFNQLASSLTNLRVLDIGESHVFMYFIPIIFFNRETKK